MTSDFPQSRASATTSRPLQGHFRVPGDKSISHRSLIIGSQRVGRTVIHNMLESEDVSATAQALRQAGVPISRRDGIWTVDGVGVGGLQPPGDVLNMGNSGTSTRLLAGLFAPYPYVSVFTGDGSLRKRPMKRIMTPLSAMGVEFMANEAMTLPFAMRGSASLIPLQYRLPVASAQVKSALMLAGLNTPGETTVIEPVATRDHTERMFNAAGFPVTVTAQADGTHITVQGQPHQRHEDSEFHVPGDPSSAAFLAVAALIVPASELVLEHVGTNETRTGLYHSLEEMGAQLEWRNPRVVQGEPVADLHIRASELRGVRVPAERAPSMIDEYPALAMAASCAEGVSTFEGLGELRVKESDRFSAIVDGLRACGVQVDVDGDTMRIHGRRQIPGGVEIAVQLDHRIAMSFLVLGLVTQQPVSVDDTGAINTSFPDFIPLMRRAGAEIDVAGGPKRYALQPSEPLVIAIDGPAASGKGTLARLLSDAYNLPHLDTGGLYRAAALKLLAQEGDPASEADAIHAARSVSVHDLSNPRLRDEKVGNIASQVSAIPGVRQALLDFQRAFAEQERGAVLDGRDIGTVVCPDAPCKLFVTASIEARAMRRHKQLQDQGIEVVFDSVRQDLIERDERDAKRKSAPLVPAEDAIHVDTTDMAIDEVFHVITSRIRSRLAA